MARQRQIVRIVGSAVLLRDYMLNVVDELVIVLV